MLSVVVAYDGVGVGISDENPFLLKFKPVAEANVPPLGERECVNIAEFMLH